ncbi:hypothetical protein LSTR_LSTR001547 [Laodelphax striatellus]|uniref:RING-type domain-containing protein n=1 Tax=Laodelphax striatellus TaxID=195883 RepID=A0A482XC05_LAOST|nr:hypothetical protein LSTR_LSTR001547 [Laodelphax striatellus]
MLLACFSHLFIPLQKASWSLLRSQWHNNSSWLLDKLLTKLDENEYPVATSQEDECVICVNAKATMQTSPCGHRVVCRKCFVKTIQMAVSQRLLPLRCVICRAKILRLKHTSSAWLVPPSASHYSFSSSATSAHSVPNSESLYSMTSGSSSFSGVSTVSSATNSSAGSGIGLDKNFRSKMQYPRQPTSGAFRRSQTQAMKYRLQEYKEPLRPDCQEKVPNRLPPIQEFQREFRAGKERSASTSTRIRCAQKIVTQLETSAHPSNSSYSSSNNHSSSASTSSSSNYFRSALKTPNKDLDKKKRNVEIVATKKNANSNEVKKKDDSSTSASSSCNGSNNIKTSDNNKKKAADEPVKVIIEEKGNKKSVDKRDKKEEKKENKKDSKDDAKSKEKKELTKAEKKELKKEAKAEKKAAKKEAKNESKKDKSEKKD